MHLLKKVLQPIVSIMYRDMIWMEKFCSYGEVEPEKQYLIIIDAISTQYSYLCIIRNPSD